MRSDEYTYYYMPKNNEILSSLARLSKYGVWNKKPMVRNLRIEVKIVGASPPNSPPLCLCVGIPEDVELPNEYDIKRLSTDVIFVKELGHTEDIYTEKIGASWFASGGSRIHLDIWGFNFRITYISYQESFGALDFLEKQFFNLRIDEFDNRNVPRRPTYSSILWYDVFSFKTLFWNNRKTVEENFIDYLLQNEEIYNFLLSNKFSNLNFMKLKK